MDRRAWLIAAIALLSGCDSMEGKKFSEINPERKDYDFMKEQKAIKPEYELLDVPLFPTAKPTSDILPMMKVRTSAGLLCTADWTTTSKPELVIAFYRAEIKEASVSSTDSGQTLIGKTRAGNDFTLNISPEGNHWKFSITVIREAKP
jgi:glutamate mutase epsilon subunit